MSKWKNIIWMVAAIGGVFGGGGNGAVRAEEAYGPMFAANARVTSTSFYSCRTRVHDALDISNGTCGSSTSDIDHYAMILGSKTYTFAGGCANFCGSCSGTGCTCNGGAGNYFRVIGANKWEFRQLHFNTTADSRTKTCNGCALGHIGSTGNSTGAHSHSDNRLDKTRHTAWFTQAGTTCGSAGHFSARVGFPQLK